MIWIVGFLWILSFIFLAGPFVQKKTGLETLDALDVFSVRQSILLCWLVFALYPGWIAGTLAVTAALPKATFRRGLMLAALSLILLTCQSLYQST